MNTEHIDRSVAELQVSKDAWAALPIETKLDLLGSLRERAVTHARRWVEAAVKAKDLSMDSPLAGEEWIAGPYAFIDAVRGLETTLTRVAAGVDVLDGFKVHSNSDGQVVVEVVPASASDLILFSGTSAEVWMQPGVTEDSLRGTIAEFYAEARSQGAVCAILGAGNVASIPPLDVIYKLFNEGEVTLLKMNPVNEYLGEIFEEIFQDFIDAGYVRFVYGGGDVGAYLTEHDDVDTIHITGGTATYNIIRYGPGAEGEANHDADRPINEKPISAELGGVSPTIIVPGAWSRADVKFQADHVVTQKMNNSGFNCVATQVVILPDTWDLTDTFIEELRTQLRDLADRHAYYPGAKARSEVVANGSGNAEVFGADATRVLVTGLDPSAVDDPAFTTEYFGPALSVVTLPSPSISSYLQAATDFANDVLVGTLGANVIVHPKTERSHDSVGRMITNLRYGGIGINTWSASVYLFSRCPWGAFPGNTPGDIGSGVGVVHNVMMFGRSQKSIARGPFAPSHRTFTKGEFHFAPKPAIFVSNRQMQNVGEYLVDFAASGKKADLVKVVGAALRG